MTEPVMSSAPVRTEDLELTPLVAGQDSFTVEYDVTYDPYGTTAWKAKSSATARPTWPTMWR